MDWPLSLALPGPPAVGVRQVGIFVAKPLVVLFRGVVEAHDLLDPEISRPKLIGQHGGPLLKPRRVFGYLHVVI